MTWWEGSETSREISEKFEHKVAIFTIDIRQICKPLRYKQQILSVRYKIRAKRQKIT